MEIYCIGAAILSVAERRLSRSISIPEFINMAAAGEMLLAPIRSSYTKHTLVKVGDGEGATTSFAVGRFLENDNCVGAVGLLLRHHGRLS